MEDFMSLENVVSTLESLDAADLKVCFGRIENLRRAVSFIDAQSQAAVAVPAAEVEVELAPFVESLLDEQTYKLFLEEKENSCVCLFA
jgi:hypothetical protein